MTAVWRIGYCENTALAPAQILQSLGFGSTLGNGRWHAKGQHQVVYAGSSRALCQLEKRVHCNGATPKNQSLMRLDIGPEATLLDASAWGLQPDWRSDEAGTQSQGCQLLRDSYSFIDKHFVCIVDIERVLYKIPVCKSRTNSSGRYLRIKHA